MGKVSNRGMSARDVQRTLRKNLVSSEHRGAVEVLRAAVHSILERRSLLETDMVVSGGDGGEQGEMAGS